MRIIIEVLTPFADGNRIAMAEWNVKIEQCKKTIFDANFMNEMQNWKEKNYGIKNFRFDIFHKDVQK